jgi:hypothetical protein
MAHTFAATGARGLVLISRTKQQLEQTGSEIQSTYPDCEVKTFALDISQPDAVQEMFKQSIATFREVHVLMANAGIMEPFSGTLAEADPSAWWGVCVCSALPYIYGKLQIYMFYLCPCSQFSRRSIYEEPLTSARLSFSIAKALETVHLQVLSLLHPIRHVPSYSR